MTAEETDVKTVIPELSESKEKVTWYNGKHVLEIDFCEEFLADNPMHYIDGVFYNLDGAVPDGVIEKKITEKLLAARVQKKFSQTVKALMDALRRICFVADYHLPDNEIHVQNGYLKTDGTFYPDKKFCRNRLRIELHPQKQPDGRRVRQIDFHFPIVLDGGEEKNQFFPSLVSKCGDYCVVTKENLVEILYFRHFAKHFMFTAEGKNSRNKHLKNYFDVSVVVDIGCGNTNE